jgi:hypothetical protein
MKKSSLLIIKLAFVIMIGQFFLIDFDDLSWSNNAGGYFVILSTICVIISMLLSYRFKNDYNIDDDNVF